METRPDSKRTNRSRRSHRKSRNGCGNCKRRRIKCDEVQPACGQCISHDVNCDFTVQQPAPSDTVSTGSTGTPGSRSTLVERATPLPYNGLTFISSSKTGFKLPKRRYQRRQATARETANAKSALAKALPTPTIPQLQLNTTDLELFHHYLSVTSATLADDDEGMHVLQVALPQLGFRFHYILHLLLAFAGYHMARLPRMGVSHGRSLEGDRHYNIALTQVSSSIAELKESTCHVVYGSSVLICLCSLAKGPRDGEYLAFSDSDRAEWLMLLRGIRSITEASRDVFYIDPVSSPQSTTEERSLHGKTRLCHETLGPEWKERLKECEQLIEMECTASGGVTHATYKHVLTCLTNTFHHVYGKTDIGRGQRCARTFQWLYQLPDEFVFDLQQRKWPALLLLSYFLVLLQQLNSYWFVKGWPEHVMGEISRSFNEQQRTWLKWPTDQIGWYQAQYGG
ncbi:hypothetical protein BDV38DRAFT_247290 [Aspergillus pseudotamarii]|uniref:Zn(2)-C6 fungal-type domain-containing protein n=1 Tax=Aspergillus pseudotamarii TaxID=132259 RepID=A0A5N6STQ9_ASPPS|nr:uncharacterized protein BDV38DRAFT_247290 [Aspergillus pseudotamarii]KAE8137140.1 hypothetical protein BDV38DRAFT_247290 [Aspergillus pseudotamarii]